MTAFCCDSFEPVNVLVTQLRYISFASKFELYKSLVTTILLRDCETWTLLADFEKEKDPGFPNQVPGEASPHLLLEAQDQRLDTEQDQLPCGLNGAFPGGCQEKETHVVRA